MKKFAKALSERSHEELVRILTDYCECTSLCKLTPDEMNKMSNEELIKEINRCESMVQEYCEHENSFLHCAKRNAKKKRLIASLEDVDNDLSHDFPSQMEACGVSDAMFEYDGTVILHVKDCTITPQLLNALCDDKNITTNVLEAIGSSNGTYTEEDCVNELAHFKLSYDGNFADGEAEITCDKPQLRVLHYYDNVVDMLGDELTWGIAKKLQKMDDQTDKDINK